MQKLIPVTILTGFLGAGKTTLLNHLLTQKPNEKIALVINEFGDVGIDDKLILRTEEEIVEMNSGVICCAVKTDTTQTLLKLVENKSVTFDRVIVELSGVANPVPLARLFSTKPALAEKYVLESIITVVSAPRIAIELMERPESKEQIAAANKILLNKIDLATEREIAIAKMSIRKINPLAAITETENSQITWEDLLAGASDHTFIESIVQNDHHEHDSDLVSMVLEATTPLPLESISRWIGEKLLLNHENLLRYKGILDIEGSDERFVFQGVHDQFTNQRDRPWKDGEERKSQVVLIGKDLNEEELRESFSKLSPTA